MKRVLFLCFLILLAGQVQGDVLQVTGTTNIEDSYIASGVSADKNYGGATAIGVTAAMSAVIRVQNLSSLLPVHATINSCVCSLYYTNNAANDTVYYYRIFKPWVEGDEDGVDDDDGDVTWNDWASDDDEWTTAGCGSGDDGGSDNSGDGTGADRKATEEGLTYVHTVNTWYSFPVSAALAQDWYEGDANENGIILVGGRLAMANNSFASSEGASNQPHWTITYTVAGSRRNREIRNHLRGGLDDEEDMGFYARLNPADWRE